MLFRSQERKELKHIRDPKSKLQSTKNIHFKTLPCKEKQLGKKHMPPPTIETLWSDPSCHFCLLKACTKVGSMTSSIVMGCLARLHRVTILVDVQAIVLPLQPIILHTNYLPKPFLFPILLFFIGCGGIKLTPLWTSWHRLHFFLFCIPPEVVKETKSII